MTFEYELDPVVRREMFEFLRSIYGMDYKLVKHSVQDGDKYTEGMHPYSLEFYQAELELFLLETTGFWNPNSFVINLIAFSELINGKKLDTRR